MSRHRAIAASLRCAIARFAALLLCGSLTCAAHAAEHLFQILLDTDNNAATGCVVNTAKGTAGGIEQVWTTVVTTTTSGATVTRIEHQTCSGGTLGASTLFATAGWSAGLGNGKSQTAAIETYVPLSVLPVQGTIKALVASTNATGGQDATSSFLIAACTAAQPPPRSGARPIPLSSWLVVPLAMLLLAIAAWARRRPPGGRSLLVIVLFVGVSGLVWAATVTLDGEVGDWQGINSVAGNAKGSAPIDANIVAVFDQCDATRLFFRIDADVRPDATGNQPPVVSAGSDQTIALAATATLNGNASDDGLPNPPATLTTTWSKLSGPGTVTFGSVQTPATTASFSAQGVYVLRLTASDGALSASDDVQITVTGSAAATRFPPVITSNPVTTGTIGQPYSYDVHASDLDPGDVLAFSLVIAPTGMTIDPASGRIRWTPAAGQNAHNEVAVRVLDTEGQFVTQAFTIDVRPGSANRAPVAADDAYEVRVDESLSVAAPGVLANDSDPDSDRLSAVVVRQPANGTLALDSDGSFIYTPDRIKQGDLIFVDQANLARLIPGVTVKASSEIQAGAPCDPPDCGIDDLLGTSWLTAGGDAANLGAHPFFEVDFPDDVIVAQLQVIGHRNPSFAGNKISSGVFQLFDGSGDVLFDSGTIDLPAPDRDATLAVPNIGGVKRARFTSMVDQGSQVGFAEMRVVGPTFVQRNALDVVVKYHALQGLNIISTPIVAHLTDDNGDGKIDSNDIPSIVFATLPTGQFSGGAVKAISGKDGHELFTAGAPNLVATLNEVAVGVIDGTGEPTIIAAHSNGQQLIAFDRTGKTKWLSDVHGLPGRSDSGGAISIATLDGGPKIIVGASVYDPNGKFLADGRSLGGTTGFHNFSAISAVADVDLDGVPEIIAGPTAYRFVNGQLTKVWQRTDRSDGFVGIANFDDDPRAEIVVVGNGSVYMLNHDGTDAEIWNPPTHAPVSIPGGGSGGAPTIADFDGDGIPEIGVAGASRYVVFKRDGSILWSSPTQDFSSNATGSTVFDFNQDGTANVIYRDEQFLRIYRGSDGTILYQRRMRSGTATEQPVVADLANDGHAQIVVPSDTLFGGTIDDSGIYVLQDVINKWGRTRGIWNQHSYHVTNVNDDGSIPPVEQPNWLVPGLNNFRTNAFIPGQSADQADSFTYKANDGALESNEATVRITIRQPNTPPEITSTAPTVAATGVPYLYGVRASDPDPGDVLAFTLPLAPAGMTIDSGFGLIKWTPATNQAGTQNVIVKVEDAHGAFALQEYAVQVGSPATVPDVVGQTQASAQTTITAASLVVGAINPQNSATVAAGTVVGQNPLAGTLAAPGSAVSIIVSTGPPPPPPPGTVPDVVGELQADARADIVAAGFVVGAVGNQSGAVVPAGFVVSQNPAAGTLARQGSTVSFVVSIGPARVPNVVGETQSRAEVDIKAAGFAVGTITDQTSATVPVGVVIAQAPPGGTAAASGSTVDIALSIGSGVPGDTTPPTVSLNLPSDGTVITIPTDIAGSVTDANFIRYALDLARVDTTQFSRLASGTAPIAGGVLGRVDPTLLENGLYVLRLTAEDANGQISTDERVIQIDGMAKVGNFRLSFTDLSIPLAGIPITIVRTYDSRVKTQEDFGIGWTLDVKRGFYENNRTPGEGWQILSSGGILPLPCRTVSETASHLTQVRLSDWEVYTFALTLSNTFALTGGCQATAGFRFIDGRRPGATLQILDGTDVFYFNGDSEVVDPDEFLPYNPAKVRLTTADGRVFDFERGIGITRIQELNGNTITITPSGIVHSSGKSVAFTRDAQNRIARITDPGGSTLNYAYDGNGDLKSFVDQTSNQTTFTYDTRHNLLEILDPLGRRPIRSEYDADGRLIAIIDANGNRMTIGHDLGTRQELITDRLGNVSVVEYDARGNIVRRTDPLGNVTTTTYDLRDNKLSETDPLGATRSYNYDANDNTLAETDALGNTTRHTYNNRNQELTRTDALGGTITSVYDGKGNLVTLRDALGRASTYAYDDSGNQITATDALGNTWTYACDSAGRRTQIVDALGNITDRSFDANGNLITETTSRLLNGALQTVTRSYQYDERNRLIREVDAEGSATERAYTASGALAGITDPLGRATEYAYDNQDRLVTTTYPDGANLKLTYDLEGRLASRTDRAGRTTTWVYDSAGRQRSTTLPDGSSIQYGYDAAGRRISEKDENGHVTTYAYDAVGRNVSISDPLSGVASSAYDGGGNLTSRIDKNGRATTFTYDLARQHTRTTFADGTSAAIGYDALGRQVTATDQAGNVTRFQYDALGNLVTVIDALNNQTRYSYDALRYRISQTDPLGNTTRLAYDRVGREISKTLPMGETATRSYDAAGNLAGLQDFTGQTTNYAYDAMSRLIQRTLPGGQVDGFTYTPTGKLATITDGLGTTTFAYDLRDRPLIVRQPDGTEIRYSYDAHGNRTELATPGGTTAYSYDAADRLTAVIDPAANKTSFTYDPQGNRTAIQYPNGVAATSTYDGLNRLAGLTQAKNGATIRSYAYTLGPTGNRTRVVENTGRQVDYTYDALFRLTQERITPSGGGTPTTIAYTYDASGNRLSRTDGTGAVSYAYDANSQMSSAGAATFSYDANGNLGSEIAGGKTTTYQHDALNRLVQVSPSGVAPTTFAYDALNNRVGRAAGSVTTKFLVDPFGHWGVRPRSEIEPCCNPNLPLEQLPDPSLVDFDRGGGQVGLAQVLRETDITGAASADYVTGADMLISQQRSGSTSFYLSDGQMSVRSLTNGTGTVTDAYDYDAFGTLTARTGGTPNVYLYNSQELEPSVNLYYLRARYYDSATGRFTARDPSSGNIAEPRSLHPYVYGFNDPVNQCDATGTDGSLIESSAAAGIANVLSALATGLTSAFLTSRVTDSKGAIGTAFLVGAVVGYFKIGPLVFQFFRLAPGAALTSQELTLIRAVVSAVRSGSAPAAREALRAVFNAYGRTGLLKALDTVVQNVPGGVTALCGTAKLIATLAGGLTAADNIVLTYVRDSTPCGGAF